MMESWGYEVWELGVKIWGRNSGGLDGDASRMDGTGVWRFEHSTATMEEDAEE